MIALAVLLLAEAVSVGSGAPITVEIHNVRNAHGHVHVDICPRATFLADGCHWHGFAPAQIGTTTITVPGVPPGDYAVQIFHDENDNDHIDQGIFGIPKEGVGFSRDAPILLGPPKWHDAVFAHGAAPQTIVIAMRYLTGPANPHDWKAKHPDG